MREIVETKLRYGSNRQTRKRPDKIRERENWVNNRNMSTKNYLERR